MTEVERRDEVLRQHQREADEAAERLATALQVSGAHELPSLRPVFQTSGLSRGAHVYLGGCSARTASKLAEILMHYSRLTGRLVDAESNVMLDEVLSQLGTAPALSGDGVHLVRVDQS